jgi:polar amino acid transport system substrate-binding protein
VGLIFLSHLLLAFGDRAASDFAVAAELKAIQQRGKLIVGVKDNVRPLGFRDRNGKLQGFEIDIAQRLAREIFGRDDAIVLQPLANTDRLTAVWEDKVDIAIARVTATSSRDRVVDLSPAYYLDGTALITRDNAIEQPSDLAGKQIAILKGSSTIAQVKFAIPTAQLVGVDSYEQAQSLLESGQATAFAADASVLAGWVQEYPQYRLLRSRLSTEALCVVMPKGLQYQPLRDLVNRAIERWQAEGWLKSRAAYWGLL